MTNILIKKSALIARAEEIALKNGRRSHWSKAVALFASEIIEDCPQWHTAETVNGTDNMEEVIPLELSNRELETALLNGANSWAQYFSGACGRHVSTTALAELLYTRPAFQRRFIEQDPAEEIETVGKAYSEAARAVALAYFEFNAAAREEPAAAALRLLTEYPAIQLYRAGSHVTQGGACFDRFQVFAVLGGGRITRITADVVSAIDATTDKEGSILVRSFHSEIAFISDKLKAAVEASPFLFKGGKFPLVSLIW